MKHRLAARLVRRRSGWVVFRHNPGVPSVFRWLSDQYRFFAERFPDTFLLVQVGRFYELYDEQAVRARRLLGLRLFARGRGFAIPAVACRLRLGHSAPSRWWRRALRWPWLGALVIAWPQEVCALAHWFL